MLNQVVHQRVNRWIGDEMVTFENQNLPSSQASASFLIITEGPRGWEKRQLPSSTQAWIKCVAQSIPNEVKGGNGEQDCQPRK